MRPLAFLTLLLSLLAPLGAAAQPDPGPNERAAARVIFAAPAGRRPTGPAALGAFDRVLPSGRIVHPAGTNVVVGTHALGVALTPEGRYAIVSNDDERQAQLTTNFDALTTSGYSLSVVDTATMRVVDRYRNASESFYAGIVAVADPSIPGGTLVLASGGASNTVYAFDLDAAGHLTPDMHHTIAIPAPGDVRLADIGRAFPSTIVLSPTGARAYVVDNIGDDVVQIDVASRTVVGPPVPVGYFPFAATYSRAGLLVANEGLSTYGKLRASTAAPPFATPGTDLDRASSVSYVATGTDESLDAVRFSVPLDRGPDGTREIGGTHPAAIAALRTKPYAFVAMTNVDRIATISLASDEARAVGGTELRLYDRGPYGTQPVALALSPDERRLYVALAGIDAIAVLDVSDPLQPHRIGLVPTGWYPGALALSKNGRYLFALNMKGYGADRGFAGDSTTMWSTLERIDLQSLDLRRATPLALASLRAIRPLKKNAIVPQVFGTAGSSAIKHVVVILQEAKTYDAMLGDLKDSIGHAHGPGAPGYVAFDESVTPNLHALARNFGLAGNFYADADDSGAGHQTASAGIATAYTERTSAVRNGRRPVADDNADPEDYPRAGYVYNALALRGKTYRDYGDLLRVSGYDDGASLDPRADDPSSGTPEDVTSATQGLGGRYAFDVPALLALSGHVDLNYPGYNPRIADVRRAAEFQRDFDPFVRADAMPAFTTIWLPGDRAVADGDRALGRIVDYLTHVPQWSSTAIFIMPASTDGSRDHVDVHRAYAIVVSPYVKRGYVGTRHVSTASVLKTEEEILGLPALSLGDALASDMSDFFTAVPNVAPFVDVDAAAAGPAAGNQRSN